MTYFAKTASLSAALLLLTAPMAFADDGGAMMKKSDGGAMMKKNDGGAMMKKSDSMKSGGMMMKKPSTGGEPGGNANKN